MYTCTSIQANICALVYKGFFPGVEPQVQWLVLHIGPFGRGRYCDTHLGSAFQQFTKFFASVTLKLTSHNLDLLLDLHLDEVLLQDVVHDGKLARVLRRCLGFCVSQHKVVKDCA